MKRTVAIGIPLTVFLLLASSWARTDASEPLAWPTDAGRCLTSTFCEFRPGHFHSGIDFSTWGKVGYRCFAVGDGSVVRARVSCGGYGRAIYVRLNDGRTTVYAHLSRFAGALADSVEAIQRRNGSAYFDHTFEPGELPVARGEVIAFTGQSGVGVPHLHFELRDEWERPLDPMRHGFAVEDASPPEILRIALTPLSAPSSADGSSDTIVLDVHPSHEGELPRVPRVIPVEGEIGIAVEIDETTDPCRYRLAPSRLELREGNELLYSVDYEGFDFAESKKIDLQIDPRFSYAKQGEFHNLWRRAGNDLPFSVGEWKSEGIVRAFQIESAERATVRPTESKPSSRSPLLESIQKPGEKRRLLRVVAIDAVGNRAEAEIELSFAPPPTLPVFSVELAEDVEPEEADEASVWETHDRAIVRGAVRAVGRNLREVALEVWDSTDDWSPAASIHPQPDGSFETVIELPARTPGTARSQLLLRARAVDELGVASLSRWVGLDGTVPESGQIGSPTSSSLVTRGGWIEVHADGATDVLAGGWLEAGETSRAVLVRPWGDGFRVVFEPGVAGDDAPREWARAVNDVLTISGPFGHAASLIGEFELPPAVHVAPATIRHGPARIGFAADTFAETCYPIVREHEPGEGPELRALGRFYSLDTGSVAPLKKFEVFLTADPLQEVSEAHVAIFVQEGDRLRYIDTDRIDGPGWKARLRTPLKFGLFEDTTPPRLGTPRLEADEDRVRLVFLAEDVGAGIDCDDVEVLFEGQSILHELDDETGAVVAYPELAALSGVGGMFDMRVADQCGNASRREERVTLP